MINPDIIIDKFMMYHYTKCQISEPLYFCLRAGSLGGASFMQFTVVDIWHVRNAIWYSSDRYIYSCTAANILHCFALGEY